MKCLLVKVINIMMFFSTSYQNGKKKTIFLRYNIHIYSSEKENIIHNIYHISYQFNLTGFRNILYEEEQEKKNKFIHKFMNAKKNIVKKLICHARRQ
jgi:hypothetical protein